MTDFAGQLGKPKDEGDITHMDADIEVIMRAGSLRGRLFAAGEDFRTAIQHCWRCMTHRCLIAPVDVVVWTLPQIKDQPLAANNTVG